MALVNSQFAVFQPHFRNHNGDDLNKAFRFKSVQNGIVTTSGVVTAATGAPQLSYGMNVLQTVSAAGDAIVAPPALPGEMFMIDAVVVANNPLLIGQLVNPTNGLADTFQGSGAATAQTSVTLTKQKVFWFFCGIINVWSQVITA